MIIREIESVKKIYTILSILFFVATLSVKAQDPVSEVPDLEVDSIKQGIARQQAAGMEHAGRIPVSEIDEELNFSNDSLFVYAYDSTKVKQQDAEWVQRDFEFVPDPKRAVWLSALFPGLGQIYNRRYWKLPILVGGYLGLAYATNWNATMLRDYTRAYADIMDNDPSTKSYMDFFPPTVKEENIDRTWLTNILKSRKDFFRRNRDLCIICVVGVYLIAMVDAYVDASLAHFDITPDLSVNWAPAVIPDARNKFPSVGLQWAFNF